MTELAYEDNNLENLGNMLKTQREIQGMTRRDVVVKTKIPLDQLESIEDGRLSSLPPVFAKGFLRAYATELGLDAETIVEKYRQMTGGFKNEPASREPLAPKYIETSVGSGMGAFVKFLLSVLLVAAALAAAFWFSSAFRAAAISMFPALERLSPEAENGRPEAAAAPSGEASESQPQAAAPAAAGTEAVATTPTTPPAGGDLVLTSHRDGIWAQVAVDGGEPEYLYLKAGQKVEFKSKQDIVVTAGQASALSVIWNGLDLGPLSEGTVAEVRFPRG